MSKALIDSNVIIMLMHQVRLVDALSVNQGYVASTHCVQDIQDRTQTSRGALLPCTFGKH